MEDYEIRPLLDASYRLTDMTSLGFVRYLMDRIDWNDNLICIKGPKGTGKTTLLLQQMKKQWGNNPDKAVYFSLDHIWFASHEPIDAVEYFYTHGYEHLFIDEVHHYPYWSRLIKTVTDTYPRIKVVYSGSSILKLGEGTADLSRRQAEYQLKGMSFREFLQYEGILEYNKLDLPDILSNHRNIAEKIVSKIKVLPLFNRYLKQGYYPFYRESPNSFANRLVSVVNNVLSVDLPVVEGVTPATVRKARKMLMVLAANCPQQPNMSALYRELETERNMGIRLLDALERAELFASLDSGVVKLKHLARPEKLFLGDTALMYALVPNPEIGAVRETFFANQMRAAGISVAAPEKGDFIVDGKWLFEVGGESKTFKQIAGIENSFVVNDGVETGIGNKIPLWLFGFLY